MRSTRAEVDYFLRNERRAMRVFMQDLARGAFTYAPLTLDQLSRAMKIDRRYEDLGLGLVDGSVVTLAEDLGLRRIATRDVGTSRRFGCAMAVRSSWSSSQPVPMDPDQSPCVELELGKILEEGSQLHLAG